MIPLLSPVPPRRLGLLMIGRLSASRCYLISRAGLLLTDSQAAAATQEASAKTQPLCHPTRLSQVLRLNHISAAGVSDSTSGTENSRSLVSTQKDAQ